MRFAVVAVLLAASGCATKYQRMGITGGYDDFQITDNTFEVTFRGNGYTRAETVRRYILRRASELTLQSGYTHFLPLHETDRTRVDVVTHSSGSATAYGHRGRAYAYGSSYDYSQSVEKPAVSMRIRCFRAPLPDDPDLIDAQAFLRMNFAKAYGDGNSAAMVTVESSPQPEATP